MTRDFKNLPPSGGSKANKKAPAKKASPAKDKGKPSSAPTPGWVWLVTGLALGLFVAVGFFFINRDAYVPEKPAPVSSKSEKSAPVVEPEESNRFDFYKLLPELEVVIPDSEIREEQKKIQPPEDITYFLQVGSFRKFEQADSLKAQLAFIGVESEIQRISSQGEDWLRVRVGPFKNKRDLNRVRNRLYSEDINSMVVKIKDKS